MVKENDDTKEEVVEKEENVLDREIDFNIDDI